MVIDADGLNALAGHTALLKDTAADVVVTPHPGEMARLTDTSTRAVQADRLACARAFACEFEVGVVLKGAHSVIALPDGTIFINTTGNAGMASGGMGDVLTGLIAGFLSQRYTVKAAMCLGVYLHGAAADALAADRGGVGFLATEVAAAVPGRIQKMLDAPSHPSPAGGSP
jgi:NAD(P)H-hydrate epimerase